MSPVPSAENPINSTEIIAEKPKSVEIGQLQEMTKEQLIGLVLELQKKVQGLSEQAVQGAEIRMESSVTSVGGGPEDVKVGEAALSGVNTEIGSLGQKANLEMSQVLEDPAPTVEAPSDGVPFSAEQDTKSPTAATEVVAESSVVAETGQAVETEQKIPEFSFWTPVNMRKGLKEEQVATVNEAVLKFEKSFKSRERDPNDSNNFNLDLHKVMSGAPWDSRGRLISASVTDDWRYKQIADFWKKTVGDEVYSQQQVRALKEVSEKLKGGEFGSGAARRAFGEMVDRLINEASEMPSLPFPPIKEGEIESAEPVSDKAVEVPLQKIEVKTPEPTVQKVETQPPVPAVAAPKYEMPKQTPEQKRAEDIRDLEFLIKEEAGDRRDNSVLPEALRTEHPQASRYFESFLPSRMPESFEDIENLLTNNRYAQSGQKMTEMAKRFAALGLSESFNTLKQFVDNYWDVVKKDYTKKVGELKETKPEKDAEFEKLPANVKEIIGIFNNEIYSGNLSPSDSFARLNKLIQEKGLKALDAPDATRVLSDVTLLGGPYKVTEKSNIGDATFFGVSGPDGSLYLVPSKYSQNPLVYNRFNKHYTAGKEGNYVAPSSRTENKIPVKVLKPFVMRKNGDTYSLEKKGSFVAAV